MAFTVYHNPKSVQIDAVAISGVQSVVWTTDRPEIIAAGDGDTHVSVARYGTATTRGTIRFLDPTSADAAAGLTGTLTFDIQDVQGASDKTVTIAGCSLGGADQTVSRDAASRCVLPFVAESAPVLTDASA
jgi:hypothetical protein